MRRFIPEKARLIPEQAERVFVGEIFDVYQWPQEMFDGSTETFEMIKRPDTVETIAIKGDKIVITKQLQPCKDWFYAYPGGRVDEEDSDELVAAKRELREEAGMEFKNWKLIDVRQPQNKIDWLVYVFLATDFEKQVPQDLDAGEKIEVLELSFDEFKEYIKKPNAKRLAMNFHDEIHSLDDLLNLPSLFDYNS